jgi:hypothetical protein
MIPLTELLSTDGISRLHARPAVAGTLTAPVLLDSTWNWVWVYCAWLTFRRRPRRMADIQQSSALQSKAAGPR